MITNTKDTLRSLMKEVNLNSKIQDDLLRCAETGKSFPYIPKTLIKSEGETFERPPSSVFRLPSRPLLRPKKTIENFGDYDRDQFRPNPAKTRPAYEKQRLQNLMAYGKDIDEELKNISFEKTTKEDVPADLFSEIVREIIERQEFLDDMTALRAGMKYLPEIQCQISLRLKELEKIDKKRAQAFSQQYGQ